MNAKECTKQWVSDELVSLLRKGKHSKPNKPSVVQYVIGLAKQSSSPGELTNSILEFDSSCPITETRLFSVELFRRINGKKGLSSVKGCSSDYHQKRKNYADDDREDRSNVVVGGEKRDLGGSGNGRRRRRRRRRYPEEDEEEEENEDFLEKLINEIEATKWTGSRLDYRSAKYMELEGLIGSKRGDRRKGMNEVKKILNKEGYMDSYNPREDDNDIFDEKLEEAIRVYHHYYNHRKGNGIIDSATLKNLTDDRRTCLSEKHMHAQDKKLRMGYYANGN